MFPAQITVHNISDLQKVMSVLYPTTGTVEITDKSRDQAAGPTTNDANLQAAINKAEAKTTTKAEKVQADPKPTAAKTEPTPVASQPTAEAGAADAQDAKPVTYLADVKPVMLTLIRSGKRADCEKLLAEFGADHGEKVPADKLGDFLAKLKGL